MTRKRFQMMIRKKKTRVIHDQKDKNYTLTCKDMSVKRYAKLCARQIVLIRKHQNLLYNYITSSLPGISYMNYQGFHKHLFAIISLVFTT